MCCTIQKIIVPYEKSVGIMQVPFDKYEPKSFKGEISMSSPNTVALACCRVHAVRAQANRADSVKSSVWNDLSPNVRKKTTKL